MDVITNNIVFARICEKNLISIDDVSYPLYYLFERSVLNGSIGEKRFQKDWKDKVKSEFTTGNYGGVYDNFRSKQGFTECQNFYHEVADRYTNTLLLNVAKNTKEKQKQYLFSLSE